MPSMAAYAALASLSQTTNLNRNLDTYLFTSNAEEKIRSLHEYVSFLLSLLDDYPKKANRWEGEIRDVAHKIEDIVEHFMWQKTRSSYRLVKPSRVKLEDQLTDVTEEIGLIIGQMMEERPVVSSLVRPAITDNDTVIGFEEDVKVIKERLCGQSSHLQVIPIVGMGGIGKTTLARTVYKDPLVMESFDVRSWLTISQDYNHHSFKKIVLGLVDSMVDVFEDGVYENLKKLQLSGDQIDESEIAVKVFQNLKSRRFLIVMDDIWGTNVLDDLRNVLPNDNNGSRIMLTTRLSDLATYPDFGSPLHEMRFMDTYQSWNLLRHKVFSNNSCPPELEDIGKEIAQRCAGLPLAIVLVAGVLSAVNTTRTSWEEIAESVNLTIEQQLEEILALSYSHLPHYLRPCFLFIGGFPEDESIHASRLIKLWIAEGFLLKHKNESSSKSFEDEAEGYLEDLVTRNLVLVTSRKSNGKIKSCRLHDAVRDLCIRKSHEEKFLQIFDAGCDLPQGVVDARRISLNHYDINDIWGPTIRTILCFQLKNFPSWLALLGSSTLVKVLNAVGSSNKELYLPSQVFELFHLRYLALIGSFNIPSAISNLVNLQTLIIHPTFGQRKRNWKSGYENSSHFLLPLEIWTMLQLRHIILYDLYMLPHPLDGSNLPLQNLQTLSPIVNLMWDDKIVQMIPNVRKLGLVYSINQEYNLHHLKYLLQLEKLHVTGYHGFSWRGQKPIFPRILKKLTLMGGGYPWEDMSMIGSLPNLQVLKLLNHACDGETWETSDEEFSELKYLLIDTSRLWQWTTQSSPFPRLECLVLRSCLLLNEISEGIGEIPTLQLIQLDNCGKSLVKSAKKIKQDQEYYGNNALQVRVLHSDEEIPSRYAGMNPSSVELEDQLQSVEESIGLIATEVMDGQLVVPISSSLRLAPNDKGAVIGIHDDLKAIKDRLSGLSSKLQVIPIVGEGGIGKTTVATTVYDDPLIMRHFQIRAWVTISQDYNPQEVILNLVDSMKVIDEVYKREKIDTSQMVEKVYKNLKCRRYLIVMDNVWNTKVWDDVRNIFPNDDNGSRIMLTTRRLDVATHSEFDSPVHELRLMDDYQSWDLLKKKVFTNSNCPPELEDVGKEIARSCAGLPLVVVLLAGILSPINKTRAFWEKIAKDVNLVVGGGLQEILSLSYTHLPHHLRPCFLFIGGFPEIANIRISTFIKLWVTEGLEHHNGCSKSLEDEIEAYLEDLVERNLVIATSRTSNGRIKSCSLHDMVRDMCIRKIEEEKFVHVMDRRVLSQGMKNERRVSFSASDIDNIWDPATNRLVRALDDRHKELPSQVFELFNVRYLTLNASLNIPSAISNLVNLQTLIIHPTFSLQKRYRRYDETISYFSLSVEIWSMLQLRHLILYDLYMLPNPPDGSNLPLENLQTLWHVKDLVWSEKILQMIPNVKRLGLVYTNINEDYYLHRFRSLHAMNEEYHLHHLKHLHQLEKLQIVGSYRFSWRVNNPSFPKTLKKLTLMGGGYPWEDMGMIGSLPKLQVLKLLNHACDGETWETSDEEFFELKYLLIDTSRLRQWKTQSSPFPRLERLVLRSCLLLNEIPEGIGEIMTLELIELQCFNLSLVESAKKIKKDRESKGNYALQVRSHFIEVRDELDERPLIKELSAEREAQVMDVVTEKETA